MAISRVNLTRRKRNFEKHYHSEERVLAVRSLGCLICGQEADNAHVKSKGSGGTYKDIVPLCWIHHNELHNKGETRFQNQYLLDLEKEAEKVSETLDNESEIC
jgi:hypothetical protein